MLHARAQGPVLGEEVQQGEGHRECAQQDVREGKVGNKYVPGSQLYLGYAGNKPYVYSCMYHIPFWSERQLVLPDTKYSKDNEESIEYEKKT